MLLRESWSRVLKPHAEIHSTQPRLRAAIQILWNMYLSGFFNEFVCSHLSASKYKPCAKVFVLNISSLGWVLLFAVWRFFFSTPDKTSEKEGDMVEGEGEDMWEGEGEDMGEGEGEDMGEGEGEDKWVGGRHGRRWRHGRRRETVLKVEELTMGWSWSRYYTEYCADHTSITLLLTTHC